MKGAHRSRKQANPPNPQQAVSSFISFLSIVIPLKRLLGLKFNTLEAFLCIVYSYFTNGKGCTSTKLVRMLYKDDSGIHYRGLMYRLTTLEKRGLIYSITVKGIKYYYLADKGKEIVRRASEEAYK